MVARGCEVAAGFLVASLLGGCAATELFVPPPFPTQVPSPAAEPPAAPSALPPPAAQAVATRLDEAAVRAEYGTPDFVRKESDSELWRYDGAHCALFLFLYRENDSYLLRYRETLPRGANDPADAACETSIRARAAPAS